MAAQPAAKKREESTPILTEQTFGSFRHPAVDWRSDVKKKQHCNKQCPSSGANPPMQNMAKCSAVSSPGNPYANEYYRRVEVQGETERKA